MYRQDTIKDNLFGFLDLQALGGGTARNLAFNSDFRIYQLFECTGYLFFFKFTKSINRKQFPFKMLVLSAYYSVDAGYKSYITANITGRVDKSSALTVQYQQLFLSFIQSGNCCIRICSPCQK